jgi:HlyD family secretion protein
VSVPVSGRVLRIELEPGDSVKRGAVVARVRAEAPALLDARTRTEAEAAVESARAALGRARAEEQRARTTLAQLQREVIRVRELVTGGVVATRELESAEAAAKAADEAASAAAFAVRAAQSELQRSEVRVAPVPPDAVGRVVAVTAPADGVVLRRLRESESVVPAGEPLLEIGDPRRLEIVSDLLSSDAVRIRPGARALIEQWGGSRGLDARVRRIEPAGFTKVSALGVEEQRVNVVLDFADSTEAWKALGDAYRVEVRIVTWEAPAVVKVPTAALFRDGSRWAAYTVRDGRARQILLEIGHQTGQEAEVIAGIEEGTQLVLHPGDSLYDGARVRPTAAN